MKKIFSYILIFVFHVAISQKKEETMNTEVVNVVKPYSPTISDAFKIKEIPQVIEPETTAKKTITYKIFSFPVAPTFEPTKGKALNIETPSKEIEKANYATFGIGNYNTIETDLFITHSLNNNQTATFNTQFLSSGGGIKEVLLNTNFYNLNLEGTYGLVKENTRFNTSVSYNKQAYNWYGLPLKIVSLDSIKQPPLNTLHTYNSLKINSLIEVEQSFFEQAKLKYIYTFDDNSSTESHFVFQPFFVLTQGQVKVKLNSTVDYLNTFFKENYNKESLTIMQPNTIENSKFLFHAHPSIAFSKDLFSLDLGMQLTTFLNFKNVYQGNAQPNQTKFYIYPNIKATYQIVPNIMHLIGGVTGTLQQNSFGNLIEQNKFLSPTLNLQPTHTPYNFYIGLKGKVTSSISYYLKANYQYEENKLLLINNPYKTNPNTPYAFGNSFMAIYDEVKTLALYSELTTDVNKKISLSIQALFNKYFLDTDKLAWNLPSMKISFLSHFKINEKLRVQTQLYLVGERFDQFTSFGKLNSPKTVQRLEPYFDINAKMEYNYNKRLSFYLKGNNLANQKYSQWLNYPVQGIQGMLGANYVFDF